MCSVIQNINPNLELSIDEVVDAASHLKNGFLVISNADNNQLIDKVQLVLEKNKIPVAQLDEFEQQTAGSLHHVHYQDMRAVYIGLLTAENMDRLFSACDLGHFCIVVSKTPCITVHTLTKEDSVNTEDIIHNLKGIANVVEGDSVEGRYSLQLFSVADLKEALIK